MSIPKTYITALRGDIFKLLPMREEYDEGRDNNLREYLDNLWANCSGAFALHPELQESAEFVKVASNLAFLTRDPNLDFRKWRSIILGSMHLLDDALRKFAEREQYRG